MELSKSITDGLAVYSKEGSKFDDKIFETFIDTAFLVTTNKEYQEEEKLLPNSVDPIESKEVFASTVSFIFESAKCDSSLQQIRPYLEEAKWSSHHINYFDRKFESNKKEIRSNLVGISSLSFSSIVGVEWRLDYYLKSNSVEKIRIPVYFVKLKVCEKQNQHVNTNMGLSCNKSQNTQEFYHEKDERKKTDEKNKENTNNNTVIKTKKNPIRDICFTCSLEELQDLVTKFREAIKQAENICNPQL